MNQEDLLAEIDMYHEALTADDISLSIFSEKTGISIKDIYLFKIGYDEQESRVIVPKIGINGEVIGKNQYFDDGAEGWFEDLAKAFKRVLLPNACKAENHNKLINVDGVAIGKDLNPFLVPRKVRLTCSQKSKGSEKLGKCYFCGIFKASEEDDAVVEQSFNILEHSDLFCKMVNTGDTNVNSAIREYHKVPSYNTCRTVEMEVLDRINIESVEFTNDIDYTRLDSDYIINNCLVIGDKVESNQQYETWGFIKHDQHTQKGLQLIFKNKGSRDNISKWELTKDKEEALRQFQPKSYELCDIQNKLADINRDFVANVTHIYKRDLVLDAANLVYHSALNFNYQGQFLQRGWCEVAIVGDTRTGKTESIQALNKHYRAGEMISSGENITQAGLIGGVQQNSAGRWMLTWGKFPYNDRRLIILDEADELSKSGIISHMSGMRSSGVCELIKIQNQRTMSRVRAIWIANPFDGSVSDHNYGVDIIRSIFGSPQDIARLDFGLVCAKEDISDEEINQFRKNPEIVPHVYTSDLCYQRVMWSWHLTPKQIIFDEGVENYIADLAIKFGKKYSSEIPLVIGSDMRIKLARLAVSAANQTFSINDDKDLIVKEGHAQYGAAKLQEIYDSSSFGYLDFSDQRKSDNTLKNTQSIDSFIQDRDFVNELLRTHRITPTEIEEIFGLDRDESKKKVSLLRKSNAIKKNSTYYTKTPPFINYLKGRRRQLSGGDVL